MKKNKNIERYIKSKPVEKNKEIVELTVLARKAGMTYGQFAAEKYKREMWKE